ncbi:TM2 domain-containing protein [Thiotrichales bacterium 19S3-7]|nr:TM2 domain-containing protein [Thiotrichales bacterium 19S3-7]MCF6802352.1 TM2 domain-containing protein [Thiotrichales bacterium 19S3-11]
MDYLDLKRVQAYQLNTTVAYLIWLFFGVFGGHRFYCKKSHAVTILILEIVGLLTAFMVIGIVPLLIVLIWWIIDAAKIQLWVNQYNLSLMERFDINNGLTNKSFCNR